MKENAQKTLDFYKQLVSEWERVPLNEEDSEKASVLWALRFQQGQPIEDADLFIAVAAHKISAVLVTNNPSHFVGMDLQIENWTER